MLSYICDDIPVRDQLYGRVISFLKSAKHSSNDIINLCYKLAINGSCSAMCNNITLMSERYMMSRCDVYTFENTENCINYNNNAILASVIRDLLYMSYYQTHGGQHFTLNSVDIQFMLNDLCTS